MEVTGTDSWTCLLVTTSVLSIDVGTCFGGGEEKEDESFRLLMNNHLKLKQTSIGPTDSDTAGVSSF